MCTVFAHKKHDVASTGIPGALLHVRNDDYVIMCLNGILTELMVKVEPFICCPFVIANATGKLVLYVKLQKALYGMLKVGCFFYRKLLWILPLLSSHSIPMILVLPKSPAMSNNLQSYGTLMTSLLHTKTPILWWSSLHRSNPGTKHPIKIGCNPLTHPWLPWHGTWLLWTTQTLGVHGCAHQKVHSEFPEVIMGVALFPAADCVYQIRDPSIAEPLC